MRAYLDGVEVLPHTVEFYFHRRFLPGYAWVFPLGEGRANVGVILRADRFQGGGATLGDLLDEFLAMPAVRERMRTRVQTSSATWQLPYAVEPPPRRVFDGALLVGDAGRFVDSLTGEGIHNAVQTALIAADVVDGALARGDTSRAALGDFDGRCRQVLGAMIARSYACHRRIAGSAPVLESLFVAAGVGRTAVRSWLNRASTDFVIHE
jgi:flavin-dependent dehydrogenase